MLGLERAALGEADGGAVGDTTSAVAEIAIALDAAGGTLELTAAVGDLVDANGSALGGVDGIDVVFEVSSP